MPDSDFSDLESFLTQVKGTTLPEPTIFALGGRGYYENPATELLAFFLMPREAHGLQDLFLSTFLECMGKDPFPYKEIDRVDQQVVTYDGFFIDLQILGPAWCLLIENKIRAKLTNPFEFYKKHAELHRKKTNLYSILSPEGWSKEDWEPVSYRAYCEALKEKMPEIDSYQPLSKWQLFAREFILHLENELNNPPIMTSEQLDFVEKHRNQIDEVQKLAQQYSYSVREELKKRLEASLSGCDFNAMDKGWGFRCKTPLWGNSDVVLLQGHKGQKFGLRVYLCDMSDPQRSNAQIKLIHMEPQPCRGYCYWDSRTGYDSRKAAIDELCKLAQIVTDILQK
jgi:hypothetical protein